MSETGQPGAATPGEHGDGTGRRDDLARTGGGWAPPGTGWTRGAEPSGEWPRSGLATGWGASSPRHGDLPAPLPGHPVEEPSGRVNGHHVNGVQHVGEEPAVTRQAPVSAPPTDEPHRETDGERLAVPAQRPAPDVEQSAADAEVSPTRHSSDDVPGGRATRWEPGVPSSAPPALQVPPVGATPSGFEVPPGFHAPTVEPPPTLSRGWVDRHPGEPPSLSRSWADRPSATPSGDRDGGPVEESRAAAGDDRRGGPADERRTPPADEAEWPGPSWNRPSWGGWAPPWAREDEPVARRAAEPASADSPPVEQESAARAGRDGEPVGRRARDERAAEWAPEPVWPYEPVRAEQPSAYDPPRAEPSRPYEVPRGDADPRRAAEPAAAERPSWARPPVPVRPFSAPPHAVPTSAPPMPGEAPASAPPYAAPASAPPAGAPGGAPPAGGYAPTSSSGGGYPPPGGVPSAGDHGSAGGSRRAEERDGPPYRRRTGGDEVAGRSPAAVPTGAARPDRSTAPAPESVSPYTARRSAPEPVADARSPEPPGAVLPQRVPAEPDVPVVPEPPAVEPSAETPELARIATHLRRDDEPAPLRERPEGFDVNAILDAVREVAGVRDAALRRTPAGAHSLRLDLADGADPAEVSRLVARLLQERMGLAAAPQNLPGAPAGPPPPVRRRSAAPRVAEPRPTEDRAGAIRPGQGRPTDGRPAEERPVPAAARLVRPAEPPVEAPESPRRRRPVTHRGRATVEESSLATAPATGSPATLGTSYSGAQLTTTETAPSRPLDTGGVPGPRVVIDHVQVSTFGLDATVEVRLIAGNRTAAGHATGPAVDGYVLRLCAVAAAAAVDELLGRAPAGERGRCFVEHAAVVPFGNCEVATVVVLLVCDGWVEQIAGSALVSGDPRQAVVRATLAAVNRRLEALLA